MDRSRLRAAWDAGRPATNAWLSIASPFAAEIVGAQGFDAVTVDLQHGALDYGDLLPMLQALRASGATPMARVPWNEPGIVTKALDAGALGVICPMIGTAEEAASFAALMRYAPRGRRSYGPTRAAFAYPDYVRDANAEVAALAMIETREGMANLDAIAATPGIDALYVGPSDLSISLSDGRLPGGFDREEPEMIAAITAVARAARAAGIRAGLHCGSAEYAARAVAWGFDLVTLAQDSRLLAAGAAAATRRFAELTA